jgi:dienelactone hydrolase
VDLIKRNASFFFLFVVVLFCTGCASEPLLPEGMPETSSPEVVTKVLSTVNPETSLHLFDYDRDAPLDFRQEATAELSNGTLVSLSYLSPKGGRVPAQMIIPKGNGPFAAIIFQHGGLGSKENLTDIGNQFAGIGAVAFMLDDPYTRPGGWAATQYMGQTWPYFTSEDLEVKIQLINDLQRAVDLLSQHPQVDPDRLAYFGISFGAAMGGLLAGVETRIKAYVLQVGDGGLVEHTSEPGPNGMNVHFSEDWAELMWPTESLHFVSRAAPASLLFQNGLHDENVPPTDAMRYQLAGSEPKTVMWYDSAHYLPFEAYHDAAIWLQPYLGLDNTWFAPNYRLSASTLDRAFDLWILAAVVSVLTLVILWFCGRERMPHGERLLWLLAVLFMGPLGLGLYLLRQYISGYDPPILAKQALTLAVLSTTAVLCGLIIADLWSSVLPSTSALVLLPVQYLTTLLVAWLLGLGTKATTQRRGIAFILAANLVFALTLVVANTSAAALGLGDDPDLRIWWPLALSAVISILVTYPLHRWLVHRGVERWAPAGVAQIEAPVSLVSLSRLASLISIAFSYLLILLALIVVIVQQSGLSVSEVVKDLFGRGM